MIISENKKRELKAIFKYLQNIKTYNLDYDENLKEFIEIKRLLMILICDLLNFDEGVKGCYPVIINDDIFTRVTTIKRVEFHQENK